MEVLVILVILAAIGYVAYKHFTKKAVAPVETPAPTVAPVTVAPTTDAPTTTVAPSV